MKKRDDQKPESSPSLKASIKDGVSNAVMLGCGESYFNAFSIFLRASTLQVGLLATLPQLFGAIMQWLGALNLDRFRRRRLVIILGASTQAVTLLPIALVPFLFGKGNISIFSLLVLMIIYYGANGYSFKTPGAYVITCTTGDAKAVGGEITVHQGAASAAAEGFR